MLNILDLRFWDLASRYWSWIWSWIWVLELVLRLPRLVLRSTSENPNLNIYRFIGALASIRISELVPSKDWIAPPTPFEK